MTSNLNGRIIYKFWLIPFSILCFSLFAFSQSLTNSPYSRYGLGELQSGSFANQSSMGGIYNALQSDSTAPFYINASNPAALATTRLTVFDFGITSNAIKLQTNESKYLSNKTALSYVALAFPIAKWWGASFGLVPYSSVGYKIHDIKQDSIIGLVKYSYDGEGGINQVYFGNGFRVKNLYAGVNVSYLFGDLIYNSRDSFPTTSTPFNNYFNTRYTQTTHISDLYLRFGAQYRRKLSSTWSLTLGATGSFKSAINVSNTILAATYREDYGVEAIRDTIIENNKKHTITIPMMLGGGFVIKKGEQWLVGLDYSMQNWSNFSSFGQHGIGILRNSQHIALGIQYIPSKNAGTKESYFKKIHYRAGFRYADTYLNIKNTAMKDYAITFGGGFPLRKIKVGETYSQSIVNLGVEIGQNGTIDNQLIRQRYIRGVFSFTLNDRWFIKRKYD